MPRVSEQIVDVHGPQQFPTRTLLITKTCEVEASGHCGPRLRRRIRCMLSGVRGQTEVKVGELPQSHEPDECRSRGVATHQFRGWPGLLGQIQGAEHRIETWDRSIGDEINLHQTFVSARRLEELLAICLWWRVSALTVRPNGHLP